MIRVREMKGSRYNPRSCDGCGQTATHQIVAYSMNRNEPHAGAMDLCERCGSRVEQALDKRSRRSSLRKLGVK